MERKPTDRLAVLLGTGLGVGFFPFAPGTVGSLWGPVLIAGMLRWQLSPVVYGLLAIGFIALGIPICTRAARSLGQEDPGSVVFDEIAAFWLVFAPHWCGVFEFSWFSAIAGFGLFRVFDIAKPWPVKRLEHFPEGLGIMADDLMAGVYAGACLALAEVAWGNAEGSPWSQ